MKDQCKALGIGPLQEITARNAGSVAGPQPHCYAAKVALARCHGGVLAISQVKDECERAVPAVRLHRHASALGRGIGVICGFAADLAGIVLGGLSAGTVLFIVSVGLSVTMGLMGFVNLAHGAFAMFGGYVIVLAMNHAQYRLRAGAALALSPAAVIVSSIFLSPALPGRKTGSGSVHDRADLIFIAGVAIGDRVRKATLAVAARLHGQLNLGLLHYRAYSIF